MTNLVTNAVITEKLYTQKLQFTLRITAFVSQSAVLSTTTSSESIMLRQSSNCVSF